LPWGTLHIDPSVVGVDDLTSDCQTESYTLPTTDVIVFTPPGFIDLVEAFEDMW
jgi:hypothetical protein